MLMETPSAQALNNQDQILSDDFRHDMRLKKILGCTSDTLLGLTFTVTSPTKSMELDSLGYRYGSRCSPVVFTDDQFLKYLEISYNSRKVNAFYAKLGGNVNILYGTPGPLDQKKSWSFDERNQLIGLRGTQSGAGITSLGVLIYDPICAENALFQGDTEAGVDNSEYSSGAIANENDKAEDVEDEVEFDNRIT